MSFASPIASVDGSYGPALMVESTVTFAGLPPIQAGAATPALWPPVPVPAQPARASSASAEPEATNHSAHFSPTPRVAPVLGCLPATVARHSMSFWIVDRLVGIDREGPDAVLRRCSTWTLR